ncbi:hypothetical protein CPC08DRAFT_562611 [Agrocybe pediades]|nr:hypothetical protein CPC08DRAFT_562611 [Agrocybe pediades]
MSWQPGPNDILKSVDFEKPAFVSAGTRSPMFAWQQNHFDSLHYIFRAGYATLQENVAAAAMHDSIQDVDPPKCHPNTRTAIIQSITDWAKGVADAEINQKSMIWLNGGAGAGKSAIARSVAELCSKQGLLLGSFFFAAGDVTRNHVGRLVATLCYKMCMILPELREMVSPLIANDPLIFNDRSISSQLTTLVINPLSNLILANDQSGPTRIPRLVVIDGLDECIENIDRKDLLFSLHQATCSMPYIRFLVCSRPEKDINDTFSEPPYMANDLYKIVLGDYSANEDIRLYLEDMFKTIKDCHHHKHTLPTTWPAPKMIDDLVEGSSGQFIYASTVIRYVESTRHRPHQRLDAIFNLRPPFKDLPFTELDTQVYRNVISKAADPSKVLDILAFPLLYGNTFPITVIEVILQVERGDGELMLADIQSVVAVGGARRMIFLNKPFSGFLSDHRRAGDLYRDPSAVSLQHIAHTITAFSIRDISSEEWLVGEVWISDRQLSRGGPPNGTGKPSSTRRYISRSAEY